jgi:hypothetical protein
VAVDDAGFGEAPVVIPPAAASNSRAGLEQNIRYLIDDLNPDQYAISSVRLHAFINAAMHLIANRTVLEKEAVTIVATVAGTYDYTLTGIIADVRQVFLDTYGLELERMELEQLNSVYRQDSATPLLRGLPRFYALYETSAQANRIRLAPTPNLTAGSLKVHYSILPSSLTADTSTVPFPLGLLRVLERMVAAEAVLVMSAEDRKARMLGLEQVREWQAMAERGIRDENFRLRVTNSGTQDRILETADQWH